MFIIMHEMPPENGVRQFKAHPRVYHMEKDAVFAAQETARRERCPAWACEIPMPPKLQDTAQYNVQDAYPKAMETADAFYAGNKTLAIVQDSEN